MTDQTDQAALIPQFVPAQVSEPPRRIVMPVSEKWVVLQIRRFWGFEFTCLSSVTRRRIEVMLLVPVAAAERPRFGWCEVRPIHLRATEVRFVVVPEDSPNGLGQAGAETGWIREPERFATEWDEMLADSRELLADLRESLADLFGELEADESGAVAYWDFGR